MPGARVGDGEEHVGAGLELLVDRRVGLVEDGEFRGDRDGPAARHRVARVDGEVEQRALQLSGVDEGGRQVVREPQRRVDSRADRALEDRGEREDAVGDVHGSGLEGLAASEGEQLVRELGPARRCGRDEREHRGALVGEARLLVERLRAADDHGEEVVEVVRDAPGEAADGLHALGLRQLLRHGPQLGDVAERHGEPRRARARVSLEPDVPRRVVGGESLQRLRSRARRRTRPRSPRARRPRGPPTPPCPGAARLGAPAGAPRSSLTKEKRRCESSVKTPSPMVSRIALRSAAKRFASSSSTRASCTSTALPHHLRIEPSSARSGLAATRNHR